MNGNYRKDISPCLSYIVYMYNIHCIYVYVNIYVYIINIYDINIVPYSLFNVKYK